ncbi:hypothetical protein TRIUR3_13126 [Triticum urartu]|uniref:Uncharacterized protein n=1 Tax=Triticum urartu TaxID=4572 RepID=M7YWT1_TRIUA|nr:hypothetical protein TRIUR3_13126 [Triticum urartu]
MATVATATTPAPPIKPQTGTLGLPSTLSVPPPPPSRSKPRHATIAVAPFHQRASEALPWLCRSHSLLRRCPRSWLAHRWRIHRLQACQEPDVDTGDAIVFFHDILFFVYFVFFTEQRNIKFSELPRRLRHLSVRSVFASTPMVSSRSSMPRNPVGFLAVYQRPRVRRPVAALSSCG